MAQQITDFLKLQRKSLSRLSATELSYTLAVIGSLQKKNKIWMKTRVHETFITIFHFFG